MLKHLMSPRSGSLAAVVLAVVAVVLVGCSSPTVAPPPRPAFPAGQDPLVAAVTAEGAQTHLATLQRIADDNGGNRASPGPGYAASVDYVAGVLRDAGFEVSTPSFTVEDSDGHGKARVCNVIAQTRTGDPERVVLVGAHLDSVRDGPGINDNGSGVAALLEIATHLSGSPSVPNAVRFAFWGSEEEDLDGSRAYVRGLTDDERDAIALYLNVDMVASPNAGYFVHGNPPRGSSRSEVADEAVQVLLDQFTATGIKADAVEVRRGSDFVPFVRAGIPSAGVFAGDEREKTEQQATQWGGRAGEVFDRCYHARCDRLDNIDRDALDRFTDAIAGTVMYFASSAELTGR